MRFLFIVSCVFFNSALLAENYTTGQSYPGLRGFVEYIPGDLPIILTAPHGGDLKPSDLPDLQTGHGKDNHSMEATLKTAEHIENITGHKPHIILCHLHPFKAYFQRTNIDEAAGEHPDVRQAYFEYQNFTEIARKKILTSWGKGHLFEMHTNGHSEKWTEFGYGVSGAYLNGPDSVLVERQKYSTIQELASHDNIDFLDLIKGPNSLGALLEAAGYNSVPSSNNPGPGDGGYFYSNQNPWRYGSNKGGTLDATHVENYWGFMDNSSKQDLYGAAMGAAMVDFVEHFYGLDLSADHLFPQIELQGPLSICEGDTAFLSGNAGPDVNDIVSFQWLKDGELLIGQTDTFLFVVEGGEYAFEVRKEGGGSFTSDTKTITTRVVPDQTYPALAFMCEPGNINLEIEQVGFESHWYSDPLGTNEIHVGDPYSVSVTSSDTIYVNRWNVGSEKKKVGLSDTLGIAVYTDPGGYYLKFDALSSFELSNVKVFADGAYERTFELLNNKGIVEYKTVFVPDGESRVELGFQIQKGDGYLIGVRPSPVDANLFMSKNDSYYRYPYPYVIGEVVKINEMTNDGWSRGYYAYLYDWEVEKSEATCLDDLSTLPIVLGEKPEIPITEDQTMCKGGSAVLTASGPDSTSVFNWYDGDVNGNKIGEGQMLTVSPTETTTYYVEAQSSPEANFVGMPDNSAGAGSHSGGFYIRFTAHKNVRIKSVKLYAYGDGIRSLVLLNSIGDTVLVKQLDLVDGEQRVDLNIDVSKGVDYKIGVAKTANLARNNQGVAYPYVVPGLITLSSAYSQEFGNTFSYYYYLYDWEIIEPSAFCSSELKSATAFVDLCVGLMNSDVDSRIHVYPNPAHDQLNLIVEQHLDVKYVEITNALGRVVYSTDVFEKEIDLSEWPDGIYFVGIQVLQERIVRQIVVDSNE